MKPYPDQEKVKELVLGRDWLKAEELLNSVLKDADYASVLNDLALVSSQLGRGERALELIEQAVSKNDSDIRVKINRFYLSRLRELNRSRGEDAGSRVREIKVGDPGLKPKTSIIMRTMNRGDQIRESIKSVLAQTFQDWELIIVNDGGDRELEKALEQLWDKRMVYAYAQHSGPSAALNVGFRLARGHWIGFLDDDDIYYPDILAELVNWLDSHPDTKVVYADSKIVWIDEKTGKVSKSEVLAPGNFRQDRLWAGNYIAIIFTVFVHRKCLEEVPGCLEGLRSSMDWEFYISLSRHFQLDYLHRLAGERRYTGGLMQIGKRSIIERNLQRNLILYYHGKSPFYSFGPGRSGHSRRFLRVLEDFLTRFNNLIPALELRKLFKEPEYAFFYELGIKLEKEGRIRESSAAYNSARKIAPKEIKAWARLVRSFFK